MSGHGPSPKEHRQRPRAEKTRDRVTAGEAVVEGIGWQHGRVPTPPSGLMPESKKTWSAWMESWFAAHWVEADLPALRQTVRLFDQVVRGEFTRSTELRLWMDTCGISLKGQQDRRWKPPEVAPTSKKAGTKYGHLTAIEA